MWKLTVQNKLKIILVEEINLTIIYILLRLSIYSNSDNSGVIIIKIRKKIEKLKNIKSFISTIILVLTKIFETLLKNFQIQDVVNDVKNNIQILDKADNINYIYLFEDIFYLIIILFNIIINNWNDEEKNSKIIKDNYKSDNYSKLNLQKILKIELSKNNRNIYCVYCLVNFWNFITM